MRRKLKLPQGGALVVSVVWPASGELKPGDVIVGFNGTPIHSFSALHERIAKSQGGEEIVLNVIRQGRSITRTVTLGLSPDRPSSK
jgi:S1-C subfamily serine protease